MQKDWRMKVIVEGELNDLLLEGKSKEYRDVARNPELLRGFRRAVSIMQAAQSVRELQSFSYLHYEKLKYGFSGYSSVRLSNQYVHRLLFKEIDDCISIELIRIDDTHYGKK